MLGDEDFNDVIITSSSGSIILAIAWETGSSSDDLGNMSTLDRGGGEDTASSPLAGGDREVVKKRYINTGV